jgi:hypothetical protein
VLWEFKKKYSNSRFLKIFTIFSKSNLGCYIPLRHGGWVPRVMQAGPGQKEPNRRVRSAQLPSGYKHSSTFAQTSG